MIFERALRRSDCDRNHGEQVHRQAERHAAAIVPACEPGASGSRIG